MTHKQLPPATKPEWGWKNGAADRKIRSFIDRLFAEVAPETARALAKLKGININAHYGSLKQAAKEE